MPEPEEGRPAATTHLDLYHRHEADPSNWEEAEAVTGRPADIPPENSTLSSRAKAAKKTTVEEKQVTGDDGAENKAVAVKRVAKKS